LFKPTAAVAVVETSYTCTCMLCGCAANLLTITAAVGAAA